MNTGDSYIVVLDDHRKRTSSQDTQAPHSLLGVSGTNQAQDLPDAEDDAQFARF